MTRLYTFGCSFTRYFWPTWADILGQQYDHFENWGLPGSGNQLIFNALNECLIKNKLTPDDQVIIMWTDICREDRYVRGEWLTYGNIFTTDLAWKTYSKDFIKKNADPRGYLIRDLAVIHAAAKVLESYNIPYIFTSMVPIDCEQWENSRFNETDVITAYSDIIKLIRPSAYEVIFNFDWYSRPFAPNFETAKLKYEELSGSQWPSFGEYANNNVQGIARTILEEIKNTKIIDKLVRESRRKDMHPTPLEHLEYVDKVLPEFTINDNTRDWVSAVDYAVVNEKPIDQLWNPIIPARW